MSSQSPTVTATGRSEEPKTRVHTRPRRIRRFSAAHVMWSGVLRILQRVVHHKQTDRREFKLAFSVRDLLSEKSRAVKAQFEALVQAVQKAGSYPAREEAARAVHAVMDALKDKLPPDVISRMAESLPLRKGNREADMTEESPESSASESAASQSPAPESSASESAAPESSPSDK